VDVRDHLPVTAGSKFGTWAESSQKAPQRKSWLSDVFSRAAAGPDHWPRSNGAYHFKMSVGL
jgi:hypothetical protein